MTYRLWVRMPIQAAGNWFVASGQFDPSFRFRRDQADQRQHKLDAVRLSCLGHGWRTPLLRYPAPSNLVDSRTCLVASSNQLKHALQTRIATFTDRTFPVLFDGDEQRAGIRQFDPIRKPLNHHPTWPR